ncbi:tyrosine-type recombinase/integrase [Enterococcus thailandicus]|uniref:tyrosine-type recombinase/integrase n=1 Tax=Enterococcus thailandicus TaxID=417368 RepID=UPI0032E3D190
MSVRKDKRTNRWILDISTKNIVTGKRKRIVRKNILSKQKAIDIENLLRVTLLNQKLPVKCNMDLLFGILLVEDQKRERKESYIATQQYMFDAHIKKYFQRTQVSEIDYQVLITFRESLKRKTLSDNYINKIMILLKKIMDVAIRQNILSDNPCRLIKKLPIKQKRMNYWTLDDFLLFDQLFKEDEKVFRLFFHLAFFTGMRKGELLALKWQDIDFTHGQITVNKSVIKLNGKEIVSEPKTATGNRVIAIHNKLCELLEKWKTIQTDLLIEYMENRSILEVRIFEETPYRIIDADRLRKKYDSILIRDPRLKRIRIHDFRHSHVALLIHQEEKPYIIKERLGHASIQTTYDIYGHLYPSKQRKLADNLDSLY